jgi:DMSO/TMAO reductase YedYZ molybdopterin-dependent catalytic subunit
MLIYAMNGRPLEPQHGFPLRLLVPGWYGMTSVKWLNSIEAVAEPFVGFQQSIAYHYQSNRDDPGLPVDRVRVRSLMVPPGIPDFFTRQRFQKPGRTVIRGRAWSGHGTVEHVEVAVDGKWHDAQLAPPVGQFAWRAWSWEWDAATGDHELACRATDAAGNVQPLEQPWNYQGMGNNMVQVVAVVVRPEMNFDGSLMGLPGAKA